MNRISNAYRAAWLVLLAAACPIWAAGRFPLVDGDCQATIVGDALTPRYPYEGPKNCLQAYIEQSTGMRLRTVATKGYVPATMPYPVFVGRTPRAIELFGEDLAGMGVDDYIVHVQPDCVILVGATPETTAWAQLDFLRSYLGIDCYFPHELGLVVPKHERVLVPVGTRRESPLFKNRGFWGFNAQGKGKRGWCSGTIPWRVPMMQRGPIAEHTVQKYITVKEYGQTRPEYFPMIDGKRKLTDSGSGPGPCTANPAVARIVIEKLRKWLDDHPGDRYVSLGMTDGGFCECPECLALDGPVLDIPGCQRGKPVCRRWFAFLNRVAAALRQSHPGTVVTTLAYAGCEVPPADLQIERNILPFICWSHSCWFDPEVRRVNLAVTDAWLARVDQVGVYEYYYGSSLAIPMIYTKDMAEYLRYLADHSRSPDDLAFFGEINASWGMDGPKVWILEKLLWNPRQDVDQLTRQWCDALFEDVSPTMCRYFRELEQLRVGNRRRLAGVTDYVPWRAAAEPVDLQSIFGLWQRAAQLLLFPPDDVSRCQSILAEARVAATKGVVRERIDYVASTLKLTEYASRTYHGYAALNEALWEGGSPAELLTRLVAGDAIAPDVDALEYSQLLMARDNTRFHGPALLLSGAGLAIRRIVQETAGKRVRELLVSGMMEADRLTAEAHRAVNSIASPQMAATQIGSGRMAELRAIAARIVTAPLVVTPPVLDGNPDDAVWPWVDHRPWFSWQSALASNTVTCFAAVHDGRYLYLALRCPQENLDKQQRCPARYGAHAYQFPSVEVFLNPDQPGASTQELSYYQAIPALGGGFMEWGGGPMKELAEGAAEYAIGDTPEEWHAELKVDLRKLGLTGRRYLRLNLVRNLGTGGFSGRTWFPSPAGHKETESRGWLILGR